MSDDWDNAETPIWAPNDAPVDAVHDPLVVIIISSGSSARTQHLLTGDEWIIGRSRSADIAVGDTSISRRHARLSVRDGRVLIEDVGSANGTSYAGVSLTPFTPTPIVLDRPIQVGAVTLYVRRAREIVSRSGTRPKFSPPADETPMLLDGEREVVVKALAAAGGNQSAAARSLGIGRHALIARIESYGLARPRKRR